MKKRINANISIAIVVAVILTSISVILTAADTSDYKTVENFDEKMTISSSGMFWNNTDIGGNTSGKLKFKQAESATGKYRILMPDMAVTPGENYEVIFDYYSDEFTGTINFGVNTANPKNVWDNAKELTRFDFGNELADGEVTSGEWKQAVFRFSVPEEVGVNNGFGFYYQAGTSTVFYIDNVEIRKVNYQFNDFNVSYDTESSGITCCNEEIGRNKSGCLKLKANPKFDESATYIASGGAIGSAIMLQSGSDYTASLKIYSDSFDGNFTFGIQTNDAANPYKDGVTQYRATSFEGLEAGKGTSGEWREVTFNFTANFTVKESNALGFFYKSSAANTIYIDDLVIKEADYSVVTFETPRELWSSAFIAGQTLEGYPKKLLKFRNKLTARNTFSMAVSDENKKAVKLKKDAGYVMSIDYYTDEEYDGSATDLIIMSGDTEIGRFKLNTAEDTDGKWKTVTAAFTSPADRGLRLRMSANPGCTLYFDNLKITEVEKAAVIDQKEISVSENQELLTKIDSSDEDFAQNITAESVMKCDRVDENGNLIIKLGHTELTVVDSGMVFRPSVLADVSGLTYSASLDSDNGITSIGLTPNIDKDSGSLSVNGSIEGIAQLYGKTDFDIAFYVVLAPVDGSGTVTFNSQSVTANILDIYQQHIDDGDKLYVDNSDLRNWIDGISELTNIK